MRRLNRGVTLIELMVVSTVTIIVSAGLFTLLYRSWMNHDMLLTQNLVQRQARTALDMVCDEFRTLSPWNLDYIILTSKGGSPIIGQLNPSLSSANGFAISLSGGQLVKKNFSNGNPNLPASQSSINNIKSFTVLYEARLQTNDGSILWQNIPAVGAGSIDNDSSGAFNGTGNQDPKVMKVTAAIITVEASKQAANGQTYSCSMTSEVRLRNQTSPIAPAAGG